MEVINKLVKKYLASNVGGGQIVMVVNGQSLMKSDLILYNAGTVTPNMVAMVDMLVAQNTVANSPMNRNVFGYAWLGAGYVLHYEDLLKFKEYLDVNKTC